MLAQLLKKKKKGPKTKRKRREKALLQRILRVKITQTPSPPNLRPKRRMAQKANLITFFHRFCKGKNLQKSVEELNYK